MAQPNITTAERVRSEAKVDPAVPQDAVVVAWRAAESYVYSRATWPDDGTGGYPPAPDALVQAVNLLTARYLARRNTPDGLLGMGEFGAARVPGVDRDVETLIGPWRRVVLA